MRRLLPLVLALVVIPSAAAAKFTFTVTTASPLAGPAITLDGDDQTATFTIVTKAAYTGGGNTAGWKVQASATAPTSGANVLPALIVTAGSFACSTGCTTNPAPTGITYPITLPARPRRSTTRT